METNFLFAAGRVSTALATSTEATPKTDSEVTPGDPCLDANAGPNADLIASMPRTELDALLVEPQPTPPSVPVQSNANVFGAFDAGRLRAVERFDGHQGVKQSLGSARDVGGTASIGAAAIAGDLAQRARQAGLSSEEAAQLQKILRDGRFPGNAELVSTLLQTRNAAEALRAFIDLSAVRSLHPDRISPDSMRTLTLGVGQARTTASEGGEGILNRASALAAAQALVGMKPADYEIIKTCLAQAGTGVGAEPGADAQTERALILKAVAFRAKDFCDASQWQFPRPIDHIVRFAMSIQGKDAQLLIQRTSAIDLDGDGVDEALQQKWQNASGAAVLETLRAEADPIYAYSLHAEEWLPPDAQQSDWWHFKVPVTNAGDEQASMLELAGAEARSRGDGPFDGSSGMVLGTIAKATSPSTGAPYKHVTVEPATRTKALDDIEAQLRAGHDVAIAVSASPGARHALAVTDVRGSGSEREFLVTDPWTGRTEWVSNQDILDGNLAGGAQLTDYWC